MWYCRTPSRLSVEQYLLDSCPGPFCRPAGPVMHESLGCRQRCQCAAQPQLRQFSYHAAVHQPQIVPPQAQLPNGHPHTAPGLCSSQTPSSLRWSNCHLPAVRPLELYPYLDTPKAAVAIWCSRRSCRCLNCLPVCTPHPGSEHVPQTAVLLHLSQRALWRDAAAAHRPWRRER